MSHQPEIHVTDLHLALERADGKVPLHAFVHSIRLRLTNDVLTKMVEVALEMGRERAPVDVELRSTRFTTEGAEVVVQVSKGRFFRTDVRALVGLTAEDAEHVRIEIREVKALGKLPIDAFIDPVLDKVLGLVAARPGFDRAPGAGRVLLVRPDQVLASLGIPLQFAAPGAWQTRTEEGAVDVRFRRRS